MFGLRSKKLKVLTYGDQTLTQTAAPVRDLNGDLPEIGEQMIETMIAEDGLGLAGPQIGLGLRLVALAIPFPKDGSSLEQSPGEMILLSRMPLVLVNPQIVSYGEEVVSREEGCLSVPGVYAPVRRPSTVFLRSGILGGEMVNAECGGLLARAIQHEIDHLNGILFIDRLSPKDRKPFKEKLERLKNQR